MPALEQKTKPPIPEAKNTSGSPNQNPTTFSVNAKACDWAEVSRVLHRLEYTHGSKVKGGYIRVRSGVNQIGRRI
jgi:hypothetical protein